MSVLLIAVPRGRGLCGRAVVLSSPGRTILGPIRVLATASARVARKHGNPGCAPTLPFGHPPLGSYVVAASLPPGQRHRRAGRYGRLGALVLEPVGGEAAVAGRRVVLHGGPLDPKGRLRPTRGGLRVSDRDMAALLGVLNAVNAAGDPLSSVEIEAARELPVPRVDDLPGGRRVAGRARGQGEVARRRFLAASTLLLAGLAAGAAGCSDETPSCCPPVTTDWGDGGVVAQDAQPTPGGGTTDGGAPGGGYTGGGATGGGATGGGDTGGGDTGGGDNGGYTGGGGFG